MRFRRSFGAVAAVVVAALALAACGGSSTTGTASSGSAAAQLPPQVAMQAKVGAGEGKLNLVVWAGYAEDGTDDKTVDWVHPFEKATGCMVTSKVGATSDEMVTLMKTGQYDGVSASGDATLRLIYGGDVAPVNTALVPNYASLSPFLKQRPWNSVAGQMYGIPHGWGANLLLYNTDVVKPAPTSWGAVFDANSPYKGKITAYDSPIYIADAAVYLKATQPALKITNPYELDDAQFSAAIALLKTQRQIVGSYWSDYTAAVKAVDEKNTVLGTTWQVIANIVASDKKANVKTVLPTEGSTGWSDTWMISSKAQHPNCMYEWMNWITSPKVQSAVAQWFGEAPANPLACQYAGAAFCTQYSVTDAAFASKIAYWTTPTRSCGDSRGNVCKDYAAWTQAWTTIKG